MVLFDETLSVIDLILSKNAQSNASLFRIRLEIFYYLTFDFQFLKLLLSITGFVSRKVWIQQIKQHEFHEKGHLIIEIWRCT